MKKTVTLKISGRVQNVGFRYHTRKSAINRSVSGFVKNEADGSVYVEATGEEEDLDQFILWCNSGPSWARVDNVKIIVIPCRDFQGFSIR